MIAEESEQHEARIGCNLVKFALNAVFAPARMLGAVAAVSELLANGRIGQIVEYKFYERLRLCAVVLLNLFNEVAAPRLKLVFSKEIRLISSDWALAIRAALNSAAQSPNLSRVPILSTPN